MIDDVKPVRKRSSKLITKPVEPKIIMDKTPATKPDEVIKIIKPTEHSFAPPSRAKKGKLGSFVNKFRDMPWWQWSIIGLVVLLLIGGGITVALSRHKKPIVKKPVVVKSVEKPKAPAPKPTTEPSKLTGNIVPIENNQLPVTGVMIENSPDARPQSGLRDAGVIFEAVAEGGITRFLALFQDPTVPDYIGPVRSVRPYYLDYLGGFDAAIAHVGGSAEALVQVKGQAIKDLDQGHNSNYYHRISSRYAPHNVYTSIAQLLALQKTKGFTSNYVGFPRKAKETPAATPTVKTIDLIISGYFYNVHYEYDAATNLFKRSEGGKPHNDDRSGAQLSPKVVIVIVVPQGPDPDHVHTLYKPIGTGKAYVFQDGNVTLGTWDKADRKTQIHFTDDSGNAIQLDAGQTWITLVGTAGSVSYKP